MHSSLILVGKRIKKINKLLTMLDNGNVKERNSTKKKKKGERKGREPVGAVLEYRKLWFGRKEESKNA